MFVALINNFVTDKKLLVLLFSGGATGGHLYPAFAIAEEISKYTKCRIGFAGSRRGIEARIVPEKGYPFFSVWISGIQRRKLISNLLLPLKILISFFQALNIIISFKPDIIVGTGGYVSWPVLSAAVLLRKKIVIQEQNQFPGLVTRLVAPFADSVYLSYKGSKKYFKKQSNLQVSGNPTRDDLENKNKDESYTYFKLDHNKYTLFVFGGSQGSLFINKVIMQYLPGLMQDSNLQILWSTGERWYEWIQKETVKFPQVHIYPYIKEMGFAYSACDLLICRAGATTIAEITRLGIPTVFIPLSTSAADHQLYNAKMLADSEAAEMIQENEVENKFMKVISNLISDAERRKKMGDKAKSFSKPNAAEIITRDILRR